MSEQDKKELIEGFHMYTTIWVTVYKDFIAKGFNHNQAMEHTSSLVRVCLFGGRKTDDLATAALSTIALSKS